MFYIEVQSIINQIINLYHRIGLWQHEDRTIYHKLGGKLFHFIVSVSFVVSLVTGATQSDNFDESIHLYAASIGVGVITVKVIYVLWKKDEIFSFLRSTSVHVMENREEFSKISKKLKKFVNFASFFCAVLFVQIVGYGIMSLPIFSNKENLPFNIGFPLDWKNSEIGFWIAYAYLMTVITFHTAYTFMAVIIWYIMFNCSIKYQILEMQFKNLGTKEDISNVQKQSLFFQELIELVETHKSVHKTKERFKSCFDKLFFAQISTSGICICGSVYVLAFSSHEKLFQSIIYVVIILYNFFDIFMVMYLGNEIKLFSGRLSYGLFQSDWMNQSKSCKNYILILMEVLKQPQELVIGVVYPLNLETFTAILKFTYSAFNILQSFK